MKKTVVISTNENDSYFFYVPIVGWMWNKFGWEVACYIGDDDTLAKIHKMYRVESIKKLLLMSKFFYEHWGNVRAQELNIRNETMVQCIRLYAANKSDRYDYIMTSDADMLPLSDYWKPNENEITTWGRDLTDYHFPMCYIGMPVSKWKEVMSLSGNTASDMKRDFDQYPKSRSDKWEEWWQVDQDIITERLQNRSDVVRVNRGTQSNGYPLGRIDRGCWEQSLTKPERIDAHLPREGYKEENFVKIISLIQSIFPSENLQWMRDYRDEYVKLIETKN